MKILIVEDVEDSRVYLRQALESEKYTVIEATNGMEALAAAHQDPPDMIISDIMMPEMDGFELCLRVKNDKNLKMIPFIFYTATYLDIEDEELGKLLGASRYFIKPMGPEELLPAIKQVFEGLGAGDQMLPEALSGDEHKLLAKYFRSVNNKLTKRNLELVKTQEKVERVSREYTDIYDNAPDMYVSVSPGDASILQCNETLLKKTGYSRNEVIGSPVFKLYHDDCMGKVKETFKIFVETGIVQDKELVLKRKDGSKLDVSLNVNSIRDKKGDIVSSISSWRDITERKQAEAALLESDAKYRGIFDESVAAIYLLDIDQRFLESNHAGMNLLGYQIDELQKMKFSDLVVDTESFQLLHQQLLAGFQLSNIEVQMAKKNGELITVLINSRQFLDSQGNVIWIQITLIDITDRKRAENELALSEEKFRTFVEQASEGIYLFEVKNPISVNQPADDQIKNLYKGHIVEANDSQAKMYGYDRADEILGKTLAELHGSNDDPENLKFLRAWIKADYRIVDMESHEADGVGNELWFSNNVIGHVEDGYLVHIWGTQTNITDRKQAEIARELALQEATAANKVKDQFIANISHEIRTPLNSIVGFSDLLRQRYLDLLPEKDQQIFQFISNSSNRLMSTVDSILNISQLEAGTVQASPVEMDLNLVTRQVVDQLTPKAEGKHISLQLIKPKQPVLIFADQYCIQQAVLSLVDNAIKYTHEGHVKIELDNNDSQAKLIIKDTGDGISEEYQKLMFQPYTQESEGFTKNYQGIGLGLALTQRYLKLNNVKINLKSKKNIGTTFTLIFPKYEEKS